MSHPLDELLRAQKRGEALGMPSICSAHPWVLRTALRGDGTILIESTCNQVNQFGGYTGMIPADFVHFVHGIAAENVFPRERILLGGDHLGPSPWQEEKAEIAMQKAEELVKAYVREGYSKIHLDASMRLADDPDPLPLELSAERTAALARAAEASANPAAPPRYIIGTEVPIPGGATEHEDSVQVTRVEDARSTLEATRAAFAKAGLEAAWERVIALVVQPGVEFGEGFVLEYNPAAARDLANFAETIPQVYEAHSTDYQSRETLQALVRDHFAILKVGPGLTFALREAVFSLARIEAELVEPEAQSHIVETLEAAMMRNPAYWQKYYFGSEREKAFARKFSLSDRIRYYWTEANVQAAFDRLIANLSGEIPLVFVEQYFPELHPGVRPGGKQYSAGELIESRVGCVLNDYLQACTPE